MAVLQPLDLQGPAIEDHFALAAGEAAACGGGEGGTGAGAAGTGDADAALPDAKAQAIRADHAGDAYVRALRKDRMMLEFRPEPGEVDRVGILDKERGVRIADVAGDRIGQRPDRKLEVEG